MDPLDRRYSRQMLFGPIGKEGQEMLRKGKVGLVGLGALGATLAEMIVRAGVGTLVAIVCSVIGCFIVLRRMSFLADAIAHSMLAGVIAGWMLWVVSVTCGCWACCSC